MLHHLVLAALSDQSEAFRRAGPDVRAEIVDEAVEWVSTHAISSTNDAVAAYLTERPPSVDTRRDDSPGWQQMPGHLRDYERSRARRHGGEHEVRPGDRADLDKI